MELGRHLIINREMFYPPDNPLYPSNRVSYSTYSDAFEVFLREGRNPIINVADAVYGGGADLNLIPNFYFNEYRKPTIYHFEY